MADPSQYLRVVLDGMDYLLPSAGSVAIEQRDGLLAADNTTGPVVAWRQGRNGRWPAYGLNASFEFCRPTRWQRAVFLDAGGQPVGLVADDVTLLGRGDMHVAPFTPLGPAPTRFGHLFNAAWVDGHRITFVIDGRSLAAYLRSRGGGA